ncbi:hypothetical protein [Zooshikella harenae]|uniref:Uncharacterized protein n=1 Tax=Zooshikella harenae TaxID=2827238 RepID=A0ABS5ZIM7_9GAMM|nr:hypothetical protein [Zooshikella harenae]MBU2713834.1 hypothetical protein [Zooshikella harenae]
MLELPGLLSILVFLIVIPIIIPWGRKLVLTSLIIWFLLWGLFFFTISNPPLKPDRFGGDLVVSFLFILAFSVGVIARLAGRYFKATVFKRSFFGAD